MQLLIGNNKQWIENIKHINYITTTKAMVFIWIRKKYDDHLGYVCSQMKKFN